MVIRRLDGSCAAVGPVGAGRFLNCSRSWSAPLSWHCASTTAAPATTHTTIDPSRRNRIVVWRHLRRTSPTPDMNVRAVRRPSLEAQSSLEAMPSRKRRPHVLIQKGVTLEQVAVATFSCKAVVYQWERSRTRCFSPVFWPRISGARQRRVSVRVKGSILA